MNKSKIDKISIITNDGHSSPRYWSITKKRLYGIFLGIPFIILLFSCVTLFAIYRLHDLQSELEEVVSPKKYKSLENKYFQSIQQINDYKQNIEKLQMKLTSGEETPLETLSLFKVTKGVKDLTHTPPLTVEAPKLTKTTNGIKLNFNLVNITQNGRRAQGHLFIILRDNNRLISWPAKTFTPGTFQLNFTKGEYFATSKFRPVSAKFKTNNTDKLLLFKILVFSTTGDLILKRQLSIKPEDRNKND